MALPRIIYEASLVTNRICVHGGAGLRRPGLVRRRHRFERSCRRRGTPERPRCRHAQLRQRRHRRRGQGGERDHRKELRSRSARQGHGEYRLGQAHVQGAGLPGVFVGAAAAGLCRGRGPRHGHDRPGDRRQSAPKPHAGTAGSGARRPDHRDAGVQAATRIGGATDAGIAPADHPQQQHHRLPEQQHAGGHGLCEQSAAHRENHRNDRPADRYRFDHDPARACLRARRRADHYPLARRTDAGGGPEPAVLPLPRMPAPTACSPAPAIRRGCGGCANWRRCSIRPPAPAAIFM